MRKYFKLAVFIVLCQMAGVIGSFFTFESIPRWYALLNKPWFTPPGWVFAPAWITLYTLMGTALYLVWTSRMDWGKKKLAVGLFGFQLLLNALWSIIFFGFREVGLALAEIAVLWIAIAGTSAAFWRIDKRAAALMLPYLAWVSFAALLNYSIWVLNPV